MSPSPRRRSPQLLAGLLATAGLLHFVIPGPYERIVPHVLPARRALVYLSGLAEIACGAGVLNARTRRTAAWSAAALFVAVFPANIQMAVDAGAPTRDAAAALAWARLPLQVPLVWWAVSVARRAGREEG